MNLLLPAPDAATLADAPVAYVDSDLEDLIPGFMENRQEDLVRLQAALAQEDFVTIASMAHTLKGSGGGYGFDGITEISEQMEIAAKGRDRAVVEASVCALTQYLERVQIVYS